MPTPPPPPCPAPRAPFVAKSGRVWPIVMAAPKAWGMCVRGTLTKALRRSNRPVAVRRYGGALPLMHRAAAGLGCTSGITLSSSLRAVAIIPRCRGGGGFRGTLIQFI